MPKAGGLIERISSPYNEVRALRVRDWVDLEVEGATFASFHPRYLLTGYSWDAITAACLLRAGGPPELILILGFGGGTVARQLRALLPKARLLGVEIDEAILDLARRHMDLDGTGAEIVVGDAYRYLEETQERFDVIVDDLFLTGEHDVERAGPPAGDALERMRGRLRDGGIVVANLIVDRGHFSVRRQARRAFAAAFPSVRVVRPPRGLNEVLVGGEALAPPRSVREAGVRFPEPHDRELWGRIEISALRQR